MLRTVALGALDGILARTATSRRIASRNTISSTTTTQWGQIWERQVSTKGGGTTPWHHRIGYSTQSQLLLRHTQPGVGRAGGVGGSSNSGSLSRWRKPWGPSNRSIHSSKTRKSQSSSTSSSTADSKSVPTESLSLSQRLKKLSREYGWAAVGVYLSLSVLDFPFCFLLVRIVGTDRIG
jgi:hypothetical protein